MSSLAAASARPGGAYLAALRRAVTVRALRLASGLVLFSYVLLHFLNHALGNVSLRAMELGLDWVVWFWGLGLPGGALYLALFVHVWLGIWAIYDRPRFRWGLNEVLQLVLGLAIPALLVNHVVATRLAYTMFGTTQTYAQQLYALWVLDPGRGLGQAIALVVTWAHGCLGLYFWLRLKPAFSRWAPLLLCGAVLVPVLALLGYVQAGRAVMVLVADETWRVENVPVPQGPSGEALRQAASLETARSVILAVLLGGVALALAGRVLRRALEHRRGVVRLRYPDGRVVRVPRGTTVLEASRFGGIAHASICGGRGRCSTCRIQLFGDLSRLPPAGPAERAVLDRMAAGADVRLACQLRPQRDLIVAPLVPPGNEHPALRRAAGSAGEERFVVAMFVDMRGSTRLAESHLPFDVVFQINRFLEAIATAVRGQGGVPNQFLGDGMLALFGLQSDPILAARQALAAVAAIGREVEALNAADAVDAPIRFGIGVDAGHAVLGEIGERGRGHSVFTAIGDAVNVAARLQSATKRLGVEALISDGVYETAQIPRATASREVAIEGRDGAVKARAFARASDVLGTGAAVLRGTASAST